MTEFTPGLDTIEVCKKGMYAESYADPDRNNRRPMPSDEAYLAALDRAIELCRGPNIDSLPIRKWRELESLRIYGPLRSGGMGAWEMPSASDRERCRCLADNVLNELKKELTAEVPPEPARVMEQDTGEHWTLFQKGPWDLREPGYCTFTGQKVHKHFKLEGMNRRFLTHLIRAGGRGVLIANLAHDCVRDRDNVADWKAALATRAHHVRRILRQHLGSKPKYIVYRDPDSYALDLPTDL